MKFKELIFYKKFYFILTTILTIITSAFSASISIFVYFAVNYIIGDNTKSLFPIFILVGLLLTILIGVLKFLSTYMFNNYSVYFSYLIRRKFINNLFDNPLDQILKQENAYYISFALNDLPKLGEFVAHLFDLLSNIFYFLISMSILFYFNWITACVILLLSLLSLILPLIIGISNNKRFTALSKNNNEFTSKMKSTLGGIDIVKENNIENIFSSSLDESNKSIYQTENKIHRNWSLNNGVSLFFMNLMYLSSILISIYLINEGKMELGSISVIMYLSDVVVSTIIVVYQYLVKLITLTPFIKKFDSLINHNKVNENNIDLTYADLKISNLSVKFKNRLILDNINITFKRNKKYLILGNSGSGKTTILNLLSKELKEYTGNIYYGEINYRDFSDISLYKNMSYVKQTPYVFTSSIKDNITLYDSTTDKKIDSYIENSQLTNFINSLPNKENELISEEITKVSGGEKQRINIARALYKDSDIYLLDEINSSLDATNAKLIEDYILHLKNKTVINVTHRVNPDLLPIYDEIILIVKGKIILHDTYKKIKDNNHFISYLGESLLEK